MSDRSDILNVNTEAMVVQVLLIGLMRALKRSGIQPIVLDEAFNFAEDTFTAASLNPATVGLQPAEGLKILAKLRESVI